jgi:hypothetical protein
MQPTEVEQVVRAYVDAALAQDHGFDWMCTPDPDVPPAMADASREAEDDDWQPWKAVPSTVGDADLDRLEGILQLRFPPSYRAFLMYRHFYELTEGGVRFEEHVVGRWEDALRALYASWDPARIVGMGLIPFGAETFMDAGPVCFDTRRRGDDGECPVVFWDHEAVGTENEVRPLFSSSATMFRALRFLAENGTGFLRHRESDGPEAVSEKARLMRRFLAIDPDGAGGPARGYWTAWMGTDGVQALLAATD